MPVTCFDGRPVVFYGKICRTVFEDDLKNEPTLTITDVSGGYLAWSRTVKLSNGQTVFFHRDNNPSAWQLEPGQKIAVYIAADDLAKEKTLILRRL